MLNKKFLSIALPIALIAFSACTSSNLNVNDFPNTADPSQEITCVDIIITPDNSNLSAG